MEYRLISSGEIFSAYGGILGYEGALKQGDNLEDLFMNVVRKNQKSGEIHG